MPVSTVSTATLDGNRGTTGRLIKVNHAGEFGAINIYRAQILMAHIFAPSLLAKLRHFLEHEKRHLRIFAGVLEQRGIPRCKSFLLCGCGGYGLGLVTALFGKPGIMACTAAVETVVTEHLRKQLQVMEAQGDEQGHAAVNAILAEELEHQREGVAQAQHHWLYKPLCRVVSQATETVIWLGLRL